MRTTFLLAFALLALPGHAELISGRVVHVTDGDTIIVLDADKVQHKIRLAGIDAPEKSKAYGRQSRESMAELVANRTVVVDTKKRDLHGRQIGKALVNGQDVNVEQIRRGLTWFYRQYERELSALDRQIYDRVEGDAKDLRRGLWADENPVALWDFRRAKRDRD